MFLYIICQDHLISTCFNNFEVSKILSNLDVNKECNVSPLCIFSMRPSQVPNSWKCAYVAERYESTTRIIHTEVANSQYLPNIYLYQYNEPNNQSFISIMFNDESP